MLTSISTEKLLIIAFAHFCAPKLEKDWPCDKKPRLVHEGGVTCSMMREELGGVVDERLMVYGTKNLRVCDASILPIIPRGNILTAIYAFAEKAAEIICQEIAV